MDLSTRQGRREQGQRIQQAVERADISIEELAGRIGCSRALIYQYLSGSTLAQPDRLQQIAVQCGVPLTFFYTEISFETSSETSSIETGSIETGAGDTDALASSLPARPTPESLAPLAPFPSAPVVSPAAAPAPALSLPDVTSRLNDSLRGLQELAQAQEGPADYRALASTCERILSLASQIGDRNSQSRAQLDLGIALNKIGDFPRAVDALDRAVALAVQTGDTTREMQARQSLGRAYFMMGRTEPARLQFQQIVDRAGFHARWRGLLSLGSLDEKSGNYQQAMARFDEAAILLEEGEASRQADAKEVAEALLYVNGNRRNVYLAEGDLKEARRLAEKCLIDAEALGSADQNLEARFDLGWCDLYAGRWVQAQAGLTAMLQLARFVGDQRRETMARATLGIAYAAAGDFEAAIAHGKDALAFALQHGDRQGELYAQFALTDAYTGPGNRDSEARYHANQALSVSTSVSFARSEIEARLRLARLNAQDGSADALREAAVRSGDMARQLGARHLESLARVWRAESLLRSLDTTEQAGNASETPAGEGVPPVGVIAPDASPAVAGDAETLQQAQDQADAALELARMTGMFETRWRANDMLARVALLRGDTPEAEARLRAAVALLDEMRGSLLAAEVADTLLENLDCQGVYARLARLLLQSGRAQDAAAFLEQTGWPPLTSRFPDALFTPPADVEE